MGRGKGPVDYFSGEPEIRVGIIEGQKVVEGVFNEPYEINGVLVTSGPFVALWGPEGIVLNVAGRDLVKGKGLELVPRKEACTFSLQRVTIGRQFHWQREEKQTFRGALAFYWDRAGISVINRLPLEQYLESVISSEMSDEAPVEFLKAHAVMARSWAGSMLLGIHRPVTKGHCDGGGEIVRWYGRETHRGFDVCADDHCQRYQGLGRVRTGRGIRAVRETRGLFLTFAGEICDARYHKACGGRTERFASAWEEREIPYLTSVPCGCCDLPAIESEGEAEKWVSSRPAAFCGTKDKNLLACLLNDYDRETGDFFRWEVRYSREELSELVKEKSGIDFGLLESLRPLARGPSGRISRLEIKGEKRSIVVGKELEIRRWLSPHHLLSSAFIVQTRLGSRGEIEAFHLRGAGWGHGVGLCQVGAAVMASLGYDFKRILSHYFPSTGLLRLY